ncbi:hypothetical protein [Arthrobacter sp. UYCu712]|uniref:hypothetical protein n=1 Tax=Arthrobacter sp. UYCu712 TaxID=3156340 RepID=UPI003393955B
MAGRYPETMLQNLISAAEQAAAPAPDYTPAIIGLSGVVIGGMIQTIAQVFKERSARVAQTRKDVMTFVAAGYLFVDRLGQVVDLFPKMNQEQRNSSSESITLNQRAAHAAGMMVAGAADQRVASYSVVVLNTMLEFREGVDSIMDGRKPTAEEACRTYPTLADSRAALNLLLNMVHPREYEIHLRFKSVAAVNRETAREEAKAEKARKKRPLGAERS